MKKLILFLTILLPLSSISQINRFYLNSNTTAYQTIIAFSDSTTDDVDICCDAVDLPQAPIWTNIGTQRYVINFFYTEPNQYKNITNNKLYIKTHDS